ncbi:MAG TPA: TonB-dependent receptor [Ideonella sp.]|nr:TonB-dependent receptor [Ideonella sp.]
MGKRQQGRARRGGQGSSAARVPPGAWLAWVSLAAGSASAWAQVPPPAEPPAAGTPERVWVFGKRPTDVGPMPGLVITKDQIPANVQSATKEQIKASRALNIGDYMNSQMQGVSVNDYAGNPFQLDVNYRGFTASPQVGTPQGLSVFFDGVRVNEPFGDVVNWDLIPLNAIDRFDVFPGSNPLFGLNTLGGAISVRSKTGFSAPGIEASLQGGSFGRKQLQLAAGANDGDSLGGFFAYSGFDEDGWRDNSPSRVHQALARGDWRGERASLFASVLYADNRLVGNGLLPIELYRERPEAVFTSPDESRNRLTQFTLGGQYDLSDAANLTGQVYRRNSRRGGTNGDIYEGFDDFGDLDTAVGPDGNGIARNGATRQGGFTGAGVVEGTPIGLVTTTDLRQKVDGGSLQFNWNGKQHAFMVGASIDRSRVGYEMYQRLGLIDASHRVYVDPAHIDPDYYAAGHDVPGNNFSGSSTTRSLYLSDTWTPVPSVTLTGAARYNRTKIDNRLLVRSSQSQVDLHELRLFRSDEFLNGQVFKQTLTREAFSYRSLNPSAGINWRPLAGLNVFGNLSRGARTPSVVELGCAFDATPVERVPGQPGLGTAPRSLVGPGCNLPTTLSGDPFLPQIRSTSAEAGFRHRFDNAWELNASLYRTDLKDDIYFVGVGDGRSYFDTVGKTRRQGMELGLSGSLGPLDVKLGYSYTDATFQSTFYTVSPHNSSADFNQNSGAVGDSQVFGNDVLPTPNAFLNRGFGTYRMIRIDPGARMPGIPAHALNINLAYRVTPGWKLGLGVIGRSMSYMRGNENNLHQPGGTDQEVGRYYCNTGAVCDLNGFSQLPTRPGRPFTEKGTVPGFFIVNLDTTVQLAKGISLFAQVSNLFDKRYYSAGRLGVNPFSPSVNGAIGPSGWNYNSSEWQNTSLVAPGAPRGIFVGLSWELGGPG